MLGSCIDIHGTASTQQTSTIGSNCPGKQIRVDPYSHLARAATSVKLSYGHRHLSLRRPTMSHSRIISNIGQAPTLEPCLSASSIDMRLRELHMRMHMRQNCRTSYFCSRSSGTSRHSNNAHPMLLLLTVCASAAQGHFACPCRSLVSMLMRKPRQCNIGTLATCFGRGVWNRLESCRNTKYLADGTLL